MVSVSRRAWPPQRGHVVFTNVGWRARGEPPSPVSSTSSGSSTGRLILAARATMPHVVAVDDRDRARPSSAAAK